MSCFLRLSLNTTTRLRTRQKTFLSCSVVSCSLFSEDSRSKAWLTAIPGVCLHDVPTQLKAGGLTPNSPVTIRADVIDEKKNQFSSFAHYIADEEGNVDLGRSASVGGSYKGVFPAGLLTCLSPAPHEFCYNRLYRKNPSLPWKIQLSLMENHVSLTESPVPIAEFELERHLMSPGVKRIPIREGRVRATLFLPAGPGPFPGVIDMFGTAGGLLEFRAAMLASRGIASLALAYFAYEDLPKTTDKFELEYFEEAVNLLLTQDKVIPDRCGVVAVSKITDIAFTMAVHLEPVKTVVSISGSPVAYDSIITYKGEKLFTGLKMKLSSMVVDKQGRISPNRSYIKEIIKADSPYFIPVEKADPETFFLVVGGGDDAYCCDLGLEPFTQRMNRFNCHNFETVLYPGAGHIIEPPYGSLFYHSYSQNIPVVGKDGSTKVKAIPVLWGGQAQSHCAAQEDLWPRMQGFINQHIKYESHWYQNYLQQHNYT